MTVRRILLALIILIVAVTGYMYSVAVRDPVIRRASIAMPDWPKGASPIKVMLVSDVHVAGPDMPPSRLARIVAQINAAKPDLVLFAGDMVSDKALSTKLYGGTEAMAPLAKLDAPLGAVAVMGNHDHWRGLAEMRKGLSAAGVTILENTAARRGPLVIGGVDDDFTRHAKVTETLIAMAALTSTRPAAQLILTHSPDIMPELPKPGTLSYVPLLLAGHTHCGQIVLPFIGAVSHVSRYSDRYACGLIREDGKTLVVGAGLGTSILPLRFGAVPDMWLLTLGPTARP